MNKLKIILRVLVACVLLACMVQLAVLARDPSCGHEGRSLDAYTNNPPNVVSCPNGGCHRIRYVSGRDCGALNPPQYAYCSTTDQYGYHCWTTGEAYTKQGTCTGSYPNYGCANWENSLENHINDTATPTTCSEGYDAEFCGG